MPVPRAPQPVTDDLLSARELTLNAGSFVIAAVALPGYPPFAGDHLDVALAPQILNVGLEAGDLGIGSCGW
jgi:hypothetical protein